MNRLEHLREAIDGILRQQPDEYERRCGFVHLYGVATICALLALKRGLDPEICTVAGMLHDIWAYKVSPADHARLGAAEAAKLLAECAGFTDEEVSLICRAIANHGDKGRIDDEMSEVLKDADVLQYYLYNTSAETPDSRKKRLDRILDEMSATSVDGGQGHQNG